MAQNKIKTDCKSCVNDFDLYRDGLGSKSRLQTFEKLSVRPKKISLITPTSRLDKYLFNLYFDFFD